MTAPTLLSPSDVASAAALFVAVYPHRAHEPERWGAGLGPNDVRRWVVAAPNDSVAAYLALWRVHDSQYRIDLIVQPSLRRRGLGERLLGFLVEQGRAVRAGSVQARPYAENVDALALLGTHGFRETMRMIGLRLDAVDGVSIAAFDHLDESLATQGIRLTTLADQLRADPRAWEKLADTNQAARFGWPDPDPLPHGREHEPETVEQFRARAKEFGMIVEACFIATRDDSYLGYSALTVNDAAGQQAGSGGTAVRPEARGLGIATALKARCVRWAQQHGIQRLATASGNPAMVHINEKFGFRRTYTEVRLVKRLA